jgi:hypothetical protein
MGMRRIIAVGLALALAFARPATAGDEHLVSLDQIQADLLAAGRARTEDLARIDALSDRPEVQRATAQMGLGRDNVRSIVHQLDDAELHDLAMRAKALDRDPVAGTGAVPVYPTWYLVPFLVVALALVAGVVLGIKALVD